MGRIARSWSMTKTSFRVIWQDKELLWLPVLSFLATALAIAGIIGVAFVSGMFPRLTTESGGIDPIAAVLGFATYLALAFVQVYFHAATVAGAHERLSGGDPTVGSALRKASKHLGRLFVWSLVVATVNVILQALRERAGFVGQIAASLAGTAWNLATYFVVPVLLFEDMPVGRGLKRSGGLFKQTWGETVVGDIGIGLVGGIVTVVIVVAGLATAFAASMLLGIYGFLGVLALVALAVVLNIVVFTVAAAVYKTALFRYASTGSAGGAFDDAAMANAYHAR